MKKNVVILTISALFILMTFSLAACVNFRFGTKLVIGNGNIETRELVLDKTLNGIKTMSAIDVIMDSGLQDKMIVEGESNILDLVEIENNSQGVLEIGYKQGTSITSSHTVIVYVPVLKGGLLETTSTGNIRVKDNEMLSGDFFDLRISSTGSMQLNLETKELKVNDSSTGSITLTGSADKSEIILSSTGNFEGFDFYMKDCKISVSGPGSAHIHVSGELNSTISGPGSIIYDGDPSIINNGGSGKLKSRY